MNEQSTLQRATQSAVGDMDAPSVDFALPSRTAPSFQLKAGNGLPIQRALTKDEEKISAMVAELSGIAAGAKDGKLFAKDYKAVITKHGGGAETDWQGLKAIFLDRTDPAYAAKAAANNTPDALMNKVGASSTTYSEVFLGEAAKGTISVGNILDVYVTKYDDSAKGGFSIKLSIQGMTQYVIHAHVLNDGSVAGGHSPVHVKKTTHNQVEGGASLVTLPPAYYSQFLPDKASIASRNPNPVATPAPTPDPTPKPDPTPAPAPTPAPNAWGKPLYPPSSSDKSYS